MARVIGSPHCSSSRRPGCRLLTVEPLERRLLLTASARQHAFDDSSDAALVGHASADRTESGNSVQVLKIRAENGGSDARDFDRAQALDGLPSNVVEAVLDSIPSARLLSAESGHERGSLVYDIRATSHGATFDLTVAADGRVIELEQTLASGDLPKSVQDWIDRTYPGASVVEAVRREGGAYEVLILTPRHQALEATLLVGASDSEGAAASETTDVGLLDAERAAGSDDQHSAAEDESEAIARRNEVLTSQTAWAVEATGEDRASRGDNRQPQQEIPAAPATGAPTTTRAEAAVADAELSAPAPARGADQVVVAPVLDAALLAAFSGPASDSWLPQVAGALQEVLPIDLAAVQQSFHAFLHDVESLAEDIAAHGGMWKLTPVFLIAAAELWWTVKALGDTRQSATALLATAGTESTWTFC